MNDLLQPHVHLCVQSCIYTFWIYPFNIFWTPQSSTENPNITKKRNTAKKREGCKQFNHMSILSASLQEAILLVAATVGGSVEAKSLVLWISRGPEPDECRGARGPAVRDEFWDLVRSEGMRRLVGEEHDFVGDSVKCRKLAEVYGRWRDCGASLKKKEEKNKFLQYTTVIFLQIKGQNNTSGHCKRIFNEWVLYFQHSLTVKYRIYLIRFL